jgi:hypothetical protein
MMRKTASISLDLGPLVLAGSLLLLAAAALGPGAARAQDPAELEELVAPIALYPDDVLGIVLPAATFPLEIVQAARFLEDLENDPTLEPDEDWDDSVIALLNYPEILLMMNDDLEWTWALGEAVLADQPAVLAAAQDFRRRAYAAGNLETDSRQTVIETDGNIVIRPANPEVVYIPYYDPYEVLVYHSRPVYRYYPVAYPVYYYPYPVGYTFGTGFFFGVTSWFSIGWDSHFVHVHHHNHYLHPYYSHTYYAYTPYYYRRGVNITVNVDNYTNVWQASPRRGSRPGTITVSGGTSTVRTPRTATVETQPGATRTRQSLTTQATGTRQSATSTRQPAASTSTRLAAGSTRRDAAPTRQASGTPTRQASGTPARPASGTPRVAPPSRPDTTRAVRSSGTSSSQLRSVPATPTVRATPVRPQPGNSSATRSATIAPSAPAARAPAMRSAAPVARGPSAAPPSRAPNAAATRSSSSSSSSRRQR